MRLTDTQEETVRQYVQQHQLKSKALSDDLIDHLCCVVENELGRGKDFDQILKNALSELAPKGLEDLQHKTIFLLNSKRIIIMKKLTYLTGLIGAIALALGITFKLLYLPAANQLFMIGYIVFLLVFIPLWAIDRFKVSIVKALSEKWKLRLGLTSSIILGFAGVFKIMHLQGAAMLLMLGTIIFALGFLPFFFFNMYQKSVELEG